MRPDPKALVDSGVEFLNQTIAAGQGPLEISEHQLPRVSTVRGGGLMDFGDAADRGPDHLFRKLAQRL